MEIMPHHHIKEWAKDGRTSSYEALRKTRPLLEEILSIVPV
jgi:hypothetical protein